MLAAPLLFAIGTWLGTDTNTPQVEEGR